jgi:hypothetical protein
LKRIAPAGFAVEDCEVVQYVQVVFIIDYHHAVPPESKPVCGFLDRAAR